MDFRATLLAGIGVMTHRIGILMAVGNAPTVLFAAAFHEGEIPIPTPATTGERWVSGTIQEGQRGCIRLMQASARDLASAWNRPRTADVVVRAPVFWTPRIAMHM